MDLRSLHGKGLLRDRPSENLVIALCTVQKTEALHVQFSKVVSDVCKQNES